jgi:hypothetical protein
MSMLVYVRQAIALWKRNAIAFTLPLVLSAWCSSIARFVVHRGPVRGHALLDGVIVVVSIFTSYLAHMVLCRMTTDVLEGSEPDGKGAIRVAFRSNTLWTGVVLSAWMALWCVAALLVGAVFAVAARMVAHQVHVHALTQLFVWVFALMFVGCVAQYSFAIPYVAFSQGEVREAVALSIRRTKSILRPLILLAICEMAILLTVSQIFKAAAAHLVFRAGAQLAVDMGRDVAQAVPTAWAAIVFVLLAYRDWVAMKYGGGIAVERREIELIDGLPAYQPAAPSTYWNGL